MRNALLGIPGFPPKPQPFPWSIPPWEYTDDSSPLRKFKRFKTNEDAFNAGFSFGFNHLQEMGLTFFIAVYGSEMTKANLANSDNTPVEVLKFLGKDNSPMVREAATKLNNRSREVSQSVLEEIHFGTAETIFSEVNDYNVAAALIRNPNTPLSVLLRIAHLNPVFYDEIDELDWRDLLSGIRNTVMLYHMDELRKQVSKSYGQEFPDNWVLAVSGL